MDERVRVLAGDLRRVFGARLESLVAYGDDDGPEGVHTLALVERLTFHDLAACVPLAAGWRRAGCAVPLLLTREEFVRTLDVFPLEYGAIIAHHVVVAGRDPFAGMHVADADLRRALELQVRSHLIHLREGYMESGGAPADVARLVAASGPALAALVANLERLDPGAAAAAGLTPELAREVTAAGGSTIAEPSALLARYVGAVERLWHEVDRWRS
jgi:hypothetical protein